VNLQRLATLFPDEHRASRDALIELLVAPIDALAERPEAEVRAHALSVYDLVKAVQDRHLVERTVPTADDTDRLVSFVHAALTG
jgi:hypothetical protein